MVIMEEMDATKKSANKICDRTIFEVSYGSDGKDSAVRYFGPFYFSDACLRAAEQIMRLDQDETVWAAWVHLKRLPDSIRPKGEHILAWTKTSNERPTHDGETSPDDCR